MAQHAWAKHVSEQNVDPLLDLYDFGTPDRPLLFKPTLSEVIRRDRESARAYFVGGDPNYPHDQGFLNRGWKEVKFQSAAGRSQIQVVSAIATWGITLLSMEMAP